MKIDCGQGEFEAGPENSMLLSYPNDMLDGLFVDLDDRYAFIGALTDGFDQLKETCIAEGIPIGTVEEGFNEDAYPHMLVIKSVGKFVVEAAEESRELPMKERTSANNRELSLRDEYGIFVRLGWLPASNTLQIHYIDEREGDEFRAQVPNDKGNDAFYHPNKYRPVEDDGA